MSQTLNVLLAPSTSDYGKAFESFIILEIHKLNVYHKKDFQMSYIRTKDDLEIDLVIVTPTKKIYLIEIKSTSNFDIKSMAATVQLKKDLRAEKIWVFSQDSIRKDYDGFTLWPWRDGLSELVKLK